MFKVSAGADAIDDVAVATDEEGGTESVSLIEAAGEIVHSQTPPSVRELDEVHFTPTLRHSGAHRQLVEEDFIVGGTLSAKAVFNPLGYVGT